MKEGPRLAAIALAMTVFVLALIAFAPSASSQEDPEHEMTRSYLYLTGERIGTERYEDPTDEVFCRDVPIYGISPSTPTSSEHDIAKGSPMYGPLASCSINFVYSVEDTFTFEQGAALTFWLDCHAPYFGISKEMIGDYPFPEDIVVRVSKNGEFMATATQTVPAPAVGFCGNPALVSDPFRLDAVFEDQDDVRFDPGDELWVWLWINTSPDPDGDIIHIAVDSTTYPSALHGVGFPGPLRGGFATTLVADVPSLRQDAAAGNATSYPIILQNIGETPREVRVSLDGDDAWTAIAQPARVTVPAGATAEVNVTVRAPMDATSGTQADHRVTLLVEDEQNIHLATTTHVVHGEGYFLLLPGDEIETADVGAIERAGDVLSEVWVEALATMIVGTVLALAHLVRKGVF